MAGTAQIKFGVGTILADGSPSTAIVIDDRVATLDDIAARHTPPLAVPPARDFMAGWERWHDWLRGLDLAPSSETGWRPLDSVKFAPPVLEPWNIFHLYHNFERPSRVTGRSDPPKSVRLIPDVFFGSRSALSGYGDIVYREHGGVQFDFEVEVTAIIGKPATRVTADQAEDYVAGYVISNDLTMHKAWWSEIRKDSPINDNLRMKNFTGYTPVSRVIVPRDIVGDPHNLKVKAWVSGNLRQDSQTNHMIWHVGEVIEYLSAILTLRPGDMILLGSPAELPLEPGQTRGILPGQTILCEVEKLGRLENRVEEQPWRQPHER